MRCFNAPGSQTQGVRVPGSVSSMIDYPVSPRAARAARAARLQRMGVAFISSVTAHDAQPTHHTTPRIRGFDEMNIVISIRHRR